jgi:hypothetical protein
LFSFDILRSTRTFWNITTCKMFIFKNSDLESTFNKFVVWNCFFCMTYDYSPSILNQLWWNHHHWNLCTLPFIHLKLLMPFFFPPTCGNCKDLIFWVQVLQKVPYVIMATYEGIVKTWSIMMASLYAIPIWTLIHVFPWKNKMRDSLNKDGGLAMQCIMWYFHLLLVASQPWWEGRWRGLKQIWTSCTLQYFHWSSTTSWPWWVF